MADSTPVATSGLWYTVVLSRDSPKIGKVLQGLDYEFETIQLEGARLLVLQGRVNVFEELSLYCNSNDILWLSRQAYKELLRECRQLSSWGQIYIHLHGG